MFFHTKLEGPKSSSRGTSSAEGPNSTWSMTINPPRADSDPPHHQPPNTQTWFWGKPGLHNQLLGLFPWQATSRNFWRGCRSSSCCQHLNLSRFHGTRYASRQWEKRERKLTLGRAEYKKYTQSGCSSKIPNQCWYSIPLTSQMKFMARAGCFF